MSLSLIDAPSAAGPSLLPAQPVSPRSPSQWIYAPWIDLIIGCGAWSAPLLLASAYAAKTHVHAWTFAFYFLALLFNYPHFMATVYRAYHTHSEFAKYRIFTVHVALLLATAGILTHIWYPLLPWIFTLYICWSPWHYTGQNFGLLMMFARRGDIAPTTNERRALRFAFVASYLMLLLSFQTGPSSDAMILSLGLPAKITLPLRVALAVVFVVAASGALVSMARRSSAKRIFPSAILALTQFLWFLLPVLIELARGRSVSQTPYSSGILAVLHSAQYLWITSYYQEREARAAGNTQWSFAKYLLTLVAGGIALFIPGPWIASRVFHADFTASFLTFMALVNIHHFILDGALWKLRDSRIASLLLDTREKASQATGTAQSVLVRAAGWFAGGSRAARAIRVSAVAVLLLWAAFDQFHFFWASQETSVSALQRAAQLNPNDSGVLMRLAAAETAAGKTDAAISAMQRAVTISPGSLSIQEALLRGLIAAGQDAKAYEQVQRILVQFPNNADAWVNAGLLAHRLGRDNESIDDWQHAVAIDPQQGNAQLYLASALEQSGEMQAAARHYHAYLEVVATHPDAHKNEQTTVLSALVKVADADAAANHAAEAIQGYKAAADFASKSGSKTFESLALVHIAELYEKTGKAAMAAASYQHALALDANLSDATSVASDWFNYGQFLRRQNQPIQLAFACVLRAETLLQGTNDEELATVRATRQEMEKIAGLDANHVRQHADETAQEAARLSSTNFSPRN